MDIIDTFDVFKKSLKGYDLCFIENKNNTIHFVIANQQYFG